MSGKFEILEKVREKSGNFITTKYWSEVDQCFLILRMSKLLDKIQL